MTVLVNHIGYSERYGQSFHRAIVQSQDGELIPTKIGLFNAEGRHLADYTVGPSRRVEGWKNRRFACVENFRPPEGGPYRLVAALGVVSAAFRVGRDLVAQEILSDMLFGITASRCAGSVDRADSNVPFHGSSSTFADVHGGWYDASGDTSKYLSHLHYANFMNPQQTPLLCWTLLDTAEQLQNSRFDLGFRLALRLEEEACWGVDFLMRMQDAKGYFYTTVFDRWTKNTEDRRICSYRTAEGILGDDYQAGYRQGGGMAIAALARFAASYSKNHVAKDAGRIAEKGWRHLEKHNTEYLDDGEENIIDDTCALLAASELLAIGIEDAREHVFLRCNSIIQRWDADIGSFRADKNGEWTWFHASDAALPVLAMMRALEVGRLLPEFAADLVILLKSTLDAEIHRAESVYNPFHHPRHLVGMPGQEMRAQFFYPQNNPSGYWWQGENARLASWSAVFRRFLMTPSLLAKLNEGERIAYTEFADAQEAWILGLNPFNTCMLHGKGLNNPAYEWDHFNVPGGVANGITGGFRDENDIAFQPCDAIKSGDEAWRWGEQWMPHAAWLLLATAWSVPR